MHFIDEGTLYHTGAPGGRSVEEQIRLFEDCWLQWAGPCELLYLDPSGEYVDDTWASFLQRENIVTSMSAGESHWQLGRCERHGAIIKNMLTRMDAKTPIETNEKFRRCLRQVFGAKNSLSRVGGFTPEQALLGKARSIPGSLMSKMPEAMLLPIVTPLRVSSLGEVYSGESRRGRVSLQQITIAVFGGHFSGEPDPIE